MNIFKPETRKQALWLSSKRPHSVYLMLLRKRFDIQNLTAPYFFEPILNSEQYMIPWELKPTESFVYEGSFKIKKDIKTKRYVIGQNFKSADFNKLMAKIEHKLEIPVRIKEYLAANLDESNVLWMGAAEIDHDVFYKIYLESHFSATNPP